MSSKFIKRLIKVSINVAFLLGVVVGVTLTLLFMKLAYIYHQQIEENMKHGDYFL